MCNGYTNGISTIERFLVCKIINENDIISAKVVAVMDSAGMGYIECDEPYEIILNENSSLIPYVGSFSLSNEMISKLAPTNIL